MAARPPRLWERSQLAAGVNDTGAHIRPIRSKVMVPRAGSTAVRQTGWRPSASTAGWRSAGPSASTVGSLPAFLLGLVADAVVAACCWLRGVVGWLDWWAAQPATAMLASRMAVAMARVGAHSAQLLGLRDGGRSPGMVIAGAGHRT